MCAIGRPIRDSFLADNRLSLSHTAWLNISIDRTKHSTFLRVAQAACGVSGVAGHWELKGYAVMTTFSEDTRESIRVQYVDARIFLVKANQRRRLNVKELYSCKWLIVRGCATYRHVLYRRYCT